MVRTPRWLRFALRALVVGYLGLLVAWPVFLVAQKTFEDGFTALDGVFSDPNVVHALKLTAEIALMSVAINLVLVSMFVFAMLRVVPGDTTGAILGQFATPEQIAEFKHEHGLDKGPVAQYLDWASGILRGDFGNSLRTNFPVS